MIANGEYPGDRFGGAVARPDFNDDGNLDLVIGAAGFDGGSSDNGAIYVIPGPR